MNEAPKDYEEKLYELPREDYIRISPCCVAIAFMVIVGLGLLGGELVGRWLL